jgi:hypothetical protein
VDEERACVVLQTAHDFHLDDLRTNALKFILNIGEPCLHPTSFLSLSPECLRLVIESDDLKCKEEIIYEKILEWSTTRCQHHNLPVNDENIRQVLGDLLYLVRFPIMERIYFTENVSKGTSASSTNKSYRRNITEILLKVVLKTITLDLINIKLNGRN